MPYTTTRISPPVDRDSGLVLGRSWEFLDTIFIFAHLVDSSIYSRTQKVTGFGSLRRPSFSDGFRISETSKNHKNIYTCSPTCLQWNTGEKCGHRSCTRRMIMLTFCGYEKLLFLIVFFSVSIIPFPLSPSPPHANNSICAPPGIGKR